MTNFEMFQYDWSILSLIMINSNYVFIQPAPECKFMLQYTFRNFVLFLFQNEDVLKKVVKDLQEHVKNAEAKYQVLKGHAEQKLQE